MKKTRSKNGSKPEGFCQVEGCDRPIYVAKHKACVGHYKRYLKTGKLGGPLRPLRKLAPAVA